MDTAKLHQNVSRAERRSRSYRVEGHLAEWASCLVLELPSDPRQVGGLAVSSPDERRRAGVLAVPVACPIGR
jgi:hypothetical protein